MPQRRFLSGLEGWHRLTFLLISAWFVVLATGANVLLAELQADTPKNLPFGISKVGGALYAQDFSYNVLFLRGVQQRLVEHPYRLDEQETMMRQILPEMTTGLSHAYSPVALALFWPFSGLPGQVIYFLFTTACALGIILLFYFVLLPRAESPLQLMALTICAISVWLSSSFVVGQSTILTTTLLGFFWHLLRQRNASTSLPTDAALALLFWIICFKPSIAIVPGTLLLACRAWRPLALGLGLLGLTWAALANHYGGWWTGLMDYSHLLNHYNNADLTPFMQRFRESAADRQLTSWWFTFHRDLLLSLCLLFVALRWTNRLSLSELFRGVVAAFLVFSPYLMSTESWVLCLLVVEGPFFRSSARWTDYVKLLLLAGVLDLRMGVSFPWEIDYRLKCVLLFWMFAEWAWSRVTPRQITRSPSATSSGSALEAN